MEQKKDLLFNLLITRWKVFDAGCMNRNSESIRGTLYDKSQLTAIIYIVTNIIKKIFAVLRCFDRHDRRHTSIVITGICEIASCGKQYQMHS